MSQDLIQPRNTEIVMYQTEDGLTKVDVQMSGETVWLSLDAKIWLDSHHKIDF